jgi:hypothetical protein
MSRTDGLIARERSHKENIVGIIKKNVAHQIVGDNLAHRTGTGTVTCNKFTVKNFYNICYRHG